MSRIITGILFIILCLAFFEAGLIFSNTIVTGHSPDINELITSQVNEVSSLLSLIHHSSNKQTALTISNANDVTAAIQNETGLDGINLQSLTAHTNQSTSGVSGNPKINVTLTVTGYKTSTSGNGTNGSIVIRADQTYNITATATAQSDQNGGYVVDTNSIKITSLSQFYNSTS